MDRPRSQVQDAGIWVRSIQPLGCPPVAKHEKRGRLPFVGRDDPARWRLFDCQRQPHRAAWVNATPPGRAAGFGLSPVHGLLKPARDDQVLVMFAVAVNHLLDVVVVAAVVADVVPVADPIAGGDGDWQDVPSISPDSCHPLIHHGDDALARPNLPAPVSESDSRGTVMVLGCAINTGSRHPAQDPLHPG